MGKKKEKKEEGRIGTRERGWKKRRENSEMRMSGERMKETVISWKKRERTEGGRETRKGKKGD